MFSKLLTTSYSIRVRGLVLAAILSLVIALYYSPAMGADALAHLAAETRSLSAEMASSIKLIVLTALAFPLPIFVKFRGLYIGLIQFAAFLSSSLLFIAIVAYAYVAYYKYTILADYAREVQGIVAQLLLLLLSASLVTVYPLLAIDLCVAGRGGKCRPVDVSNGEVLLSSSELVRVKVYGDSSKIGLRIDPENSIKVKEVRKTMLYEYIDLHPLSSFGGRLEVCYEDKIIAELRCKYARSEYKSLKFNVYFNDDYVGSYEYKVESYKTVREALEPALDAVVAKLGIDKSDVRDVKFYTKDRVSVPSDLIVSDLEAVDELDAMIYSTEKIMELYKYYAKGEIFELWESLVKRLEFLRSEMNSAASEVGEQLRRARAIFRNWW